MAALKTLLPVDGSECSLAAVRHALKASDGQAARRFVLVNVQEPPSLYEVVVAHDAERITALRRDAGADLLARAEALLEASGVAFESEVAGGEPENLILELAENYGCEAIVMGARGLGAEPGTEGEAARGLGSVALAVLEASALPVTVVRSIAASDAGGGAAEAT